MQVIIDPNSPPPPYDEAIRPQSPQRSVEAKAASTLSTSIKKREFVNEETRHLFTGLLAGSVTSLQEVKEMIAKGAKPNVDHLSVLFRTIRGPVKEYREIALFFTKELGIKPTEETFKDFLLGRFAPKDLDLLPMEGVKFSEDMLRHVLLFEYSKEVFEKFLSHGAPFTDSTKYFTKSSEMRDWVDERYQQLHPIPRQTLGERIGDFLKSAISFLTRLFFCWRGS